MRTQDINIFSPWLMVNIAILMAVTQFCGCKPNSVDKCVENFVLVSRDTLSLFLPMLKEEALNLHAHKKFLHYSFITVAEIFLFFRKLRNYRRIRIFAMQKCYVKSINLCVVICFS